MSLISLKVVGQATNNNSGKSRERPTYLDLDFCSIG